MHGKKERKWMIGCYKPFIGARNNCRKSSVLSEKPLMLFSVFPLLFLLIACTGLEETRKETAYHTDEPFIRVQLLPAEKEVVVHPENTWEIKNGGEREEIKKGEKSQITVSYHGKGRVFASTPEGDVKGEKILFKPENDGLFRISAGKQGDIQEQGKYGGHLSFYPAENNTVETILTLPVERYLLGVIPAELGGDSPLQALQAQTVAARSEAMVALETDKYAGENHDICSTHMSQVFTDWERRTEQSDKAVRQTRGIIMKYEGEPVSAYYSAHCGGHTEDIRNVWFDRTDEKSYWDAGTFDGKNGEDYKMDLTCEKEAGKWIENNPPSFCNPDFYSMPGWTHDNFRWVYKICAMELTRKVSRLKDIGRVVDIQPLQRGVSGRLIEVEFAGEEGSVRVGPEFDIRDVFSPLLKSACFVVEKEGDKERPEHFILYGAGRGHGVGMCQTGAMGMANAGKSFREILLHYYQHVTLEEVY